ncbi:amidohydrolase family protein [Lacibacter sp. MH-610]|uniref:amidohydrolase family protein n=1 Tax=Lacibacter sp. MH-610 TaxID=3020883 RepID=UPI003892B2BE
MRSSAFTCLLLLLAGAAFSQQTTWINNVAIVNTKDGKLQPAQTVVVQGEKIIQVTKYNAKTKLPDSVKVVDGTGKFIMPGMVDGHIHFFQSGGLYTRPDGLNLGKVYPYENDQQWIRENHNDLMRRYLACGITTVADVGGPMSNYDVRKKNSENSNSPGAWVTGPLISTYQPPNLDKKDPPIIKVNNEEEARELVRKQIPFKPDFIKIWYIVNPGQKAAATLPIVKAAIDETHKNGLKVCVHATEYETAKLAVEAGADILVHSVDDQLLDDAFLKQMKEKNVTYIPTAIVAKKYREVFTQQNDITTHDLTYAHPFIVNQLFDLKHLKAKEIGFDYKGYAKAVKLHDKTDTVIWQNIKRVTDAGINIVAGTDAGNIGTMHASGLYTELMVMRKSGMSNAQVLRSCTYNAAMGFGKEAETGSIAPNKLANFLLLNKNPFDSLAYVNDFDFVMNRGKWIKKDTLLPVTPQLLVDQQLAAYNARNIDAFLIPYSDSVELYEYPGKLMGKGKEEMRKMYTGMFQQVTQLHCELVNRIIQGNVIIDHESVSGFGNKPVRAIAIYTISKGKIQKVEFIQ